MKKFLDYADQYIQESDWKVIAALKLCLLSLGICLGLFIVTYIPLMAKFVTLLCRDARES